MFPGARERVHLEQMGLDLTRFLGKTYYVLKNL